MKKFLLLGFILSLLSYSANLHAQERTVSGKVTSSEDGSALPGVNVVVQGTTSGTVTDIDGNYSVSVPSEGGTLVFSFIGLTTEEIEIGSRSVVDLQMSPDTKHLSEVIVVAYGEQTRQSITGSIDQLGEEDISNIQTGNVVQGLVGKVPGVQIITQSGQPGDSPSVRFRGIGSVNATNDPLYVIDGVPFNGNINALAPQDIASMTFLKDASANALYGSRGANGVILITTKKGKEEGLEITFDSKIGFNTRGVEEYNIVDTPAGYYEAWFDRIRLSNIYTTGLDPVDAANQAAAGLVTGSYGLGYNNYDVADDQIIDPGTGKVRAGANLLYHDDWQDELFKRSKRQEYYLGLRAKKDNLAAYFSMGHLNNEGYALNSNFKRFTSRLSVDFDYSKNLKVGGSINYGRTEQNAPIQDVATNTYSNLFSWARNIAPIYPVYARDADGNFILDNNGARTYDFGELDDGVPGVRPYGAFNNPVATSLNDVDRNLYENFSGRVYGEVSFLKNFKFTYNISADIYNGDFTEFATPIGGDAKGVNGRLTVSSNTGTTFAHQQLLNWGKDLGAHTVSALIGHESNDYNFKYLSGHRTNLVVGNLPVLDNTSNFQSLSSFERNYNVEGFFGRVSYSFSDKYFFNGNYRRDGSSVFFKDNRWGNFYGLGGAWIISNEDFMSGLKALNHLKLKGSFGQQGNDSFTYDGSTTRNYYAHLDQYRVINSGNGQSGLQLVSLGNPDLQWENSTNINAGFEIEVLNNRINLDAEYFVRRVEDMIFHNPLPLSSGAESIAENVGNMENKGIEVALGATIIENDDFTWMFNVNATHFKNEITKLPDEFIDDRNFRLEEGRGRYDYYMREFAGVDPDNGDGLWYIDVLDAEGNPTGERETTNDHASATEYFIGKSAIPDLYGGFSNFLQFKNFSLDVALAYQLGGYGYDGVYQALLGSAGDIGQNFHKDVEKSWTPENPQASIPRLDVTDSDQSNGSDFWLVDATYLSLQNITFGYDLPRSLLSKIKISSAKIYIAANNVYLWSKRQGYDPRLSTIGTASNEYSIMRSISFGLSAKF